MCPLCYLIGIILIVGSYAKPPYFWCSNQVMRVRAWLGDRGARIFYYAIGGSILAIGIALSVR